MRELMGNKTEVRFPHPMSSKSVIFTLGVLRREAHVRESVDSGEHQTQEVLKGINIVGQGLRVHVSMLRTAAGGVCGVNSVRRMQGKPRYDHFLCVECT